MTSVMGEGELELVAVGGLGGCWGCQRVLCERKRTSSATSDSTFSPGGSQQQPMGGHNRNYSGK